MSEDDCCLPEVLETEQVVEIMDESQLLDLAASMETRGELVAGTSCKHFEATDTENRLLAAGMKRKREYVHSTVISSTLLNIVRCPVIFQ